MNEVGWIRSAALVERPASRRERDLTAEESAMTETLFNPKTCEFAEFDPETRR